MFLRNSAIGNLILVALAGWLLFPARRPRWPARDYAIMVAIGIIVLMIDLINSLVRGKGAVAGADPYEGLTLEWATASPPPDHGFDLVPEVRSATPLVDVREAELADAAGQGASV